MVFCKTIPKDEAIGHVRSKRLFDKIKKSLYSIVAHVYEDATRNPPSWIVHGLNRDANCSAWLHGLDLRKFT